MEWLKNDAKDMSFNGVKDDIIYNSSINPYPFFYGGNQWSVRWNNGLLFSSLDHKSENTVDEDTFFEIWDEIRSKSLFPTPHENQSHTLVYALLEALGYLSEIRFKDSKSAKMIEGYQLNEGSGRLFSLKGNSRSTS